MNASASPLKLASIGVLAVIFVGAGVMHFVRPEGFEEIVPPALPQKKALVYLSGLAEIVGGIGLLFRKTRKAAGWGLVALLVAVFPANVYMAVSGRFAHLAPQWVLWARLPLQPLLMLWVWWTAIREP